MADDKLEFAYINSKGFGIIPKLVMQDREIGIIAKAIYAYFCSFAGAGNTCFPSRDKICHDLNISKGCLTKYIKQLSEHGYIKIRQETEHGKFSHNVYEIVTEKSIGKISAPEIVETKEKSNPKKKPKSGEKKSKKFIPPTVDEISAFCQSINISIDPGLFYDYYQSNGWKVGKNPMVDWKAAVRNWNRRNTDKGGNMNAEQTNGNKGFIPSEGFKK